MKYLIFVLFFTITTIFAAENFPIMMQIKTDLNIPEDFRGGVEEGLTENGYSLVSEETQIQTIKEQANQRKKECYDESCLVDVGKMLAAKGLFLVEVTKKSDKLYLFKTKYIDFETGTTQKIKQDYFKYDLSDYEELSKFGKNIIQNMFGKIETKEVMKEVKTKDNSNEKAVKNGESVKIPNKDYKMDITEVTNKEYEKCVSSGKCEKQHYNDKKCYVYNKKSWNTSNISGEFKEDKKPAVCVDFQQAKSYCEWAGKRLPTEDEWEYAAKGGKNYKYAGSNNADEVAWYRENSNNSTQKVATKKANDYGLYDMSGNVWEWTNSWYDSSNTICILRGGSFSVNDDNIRVDYCFNFSPTNINDSIGFRCVQDVK